MNITTLTSDPVKRKLNELKPSASEVVRVKDVSYDSAMAENGQGFWMVVQPEKEQKDILLCSLDGKTIITREPSREFLVNKVEFMDGSFSNEPVCQLQSLTPGNVFVPTEEVEGVSSKGARYMVWENSKSPVDKVTALLLLEFGPPLTIRRFLYLDKDRPVKLGRDFHIKIKP